MGGSVNALMPVQFSQSPESASAAEQACAHHKTNTAGLNHRPPAGHAQTACSVGQKGRATKYSVPRPGFLGTFLTCQAESACTGHF